MICVHFVSKLQILTLRPVALPLCLFLYGVLKVFPFAVSQAKPLAFTKESGMF